MTSSIFKRLFSLNLALLMALMLAIPAAAQEFSETADPAALADAAETLAAERYAKGTLPAEDEQLTLLAESCAFILDSDSHQVSGTENDSGTGWSYDAAENQLTLTSAYSGAPIQVYTGLTIRVEGEVTITAPYSEGFGTAAITHKIPTDQTPTETDTLVIEVPSGSSLTAKGGYSTYGSYYGSSSAIYSNYNVTINSQGFVILVGGDSFYHGYTSSGAAKNACGGDGIYADNITLSGHQIAASGGDICTDSASYGNAGSGLFAVESVTLSGSNFTLSGGKAGHRGGNGIDADTITIRADDSNIFGGASTASGGAGLYGYSGITLRGSDVSVTGGNANTTSGSGGTAVISSGPISISADCRLQGGIGFNGGHGIYAVGNIYLSSGAVTAMGGNGDSTGGTGGSGAATLASIFVYTDCTLRGGTGSKTAYGIYYCARCVFGLVTARIQGRGSSDAMPIARGSTSATSPEYHPHTEREALSDNTLLIFINEYWLTLSGNGGTFNGKATFSDLSTYPTYYNLAEYPFTKTDHALMGWSTNPKVPATGTNLLALTASIYPTNDATVYAIWTTVTPENLIVLNGLDGRLAENYLFKSYCDTPVTLPSSLSYNENNSLLAWSTEVVPQADSTTHLFSGQWYAGGDTITPIRDTPTLLYAQSESGGAYAVYHPNGGTFKDGGTLLVQGTRTTGSDLQVLTPDASCITAPDDYSFAGWATASAQYDGGADLTLEEGTTTHLYAQWKKAALETEADGLQITYYPVKQMLQITAPAGWNAASASTQLAAALYDGSGKLLAASMGPLGAEALKLEMAYASDSAPVLQVFALDQAHRPMTKKTELDLSTLES